MLENAGKSFIEVQFPVSELSHESYKERKAGSGQTLTGLGKWWGRKPLVLVRATVLGLLMPASEDAAADRECFLAMMAMDAEGLWQRCPAGIQKKMGREAFDALPYEAKLALPGFRRPEQLDNLTPEAWARINAHLGTKATTLPELVAELGIRRWGHVPVLADVFCGGGSIPFEAARLGCEVHASDLNPVAGLLTWSALNLLSLPPAEVEALKDFQKNVYEAVQARMDELGFERNEQGETADYYLYLVEADCPYCSTRVPLAPSFVVSVKQATAAVLRHDASHARYDLDVRSGLSKGEMDAAKLGTVRKGSLHCPNCGNVTPVTTLRGDRKASGDTERAYGLRQWENADVVPREDDTFQERLYAVRWVTADGKKEYRTPTAADLDRETAVTAYVQEHLAEWQERGFVPFDRIQPGEKTEELFRTRGWRYWHQLFNPRQLLLNAMFVEEATGRAKTQAEVAMGLLGCNRVVHNVSRLNLWDRAYDKSPFVFTNQALNTNFDYACRTSTSIGSGWDVPLVSPSFEATSDVALQDARSNTILPMTLGVTDPPYADAVNYHELTEFFLAWDKPWIPKAFPEWYADSKRELAVKGTGTSFKRTMVDIYSNLAAHTADDGYQVIMFTHQDAAVWADLALIVIGSGLQATQAWTISTETESGGLKDGNYVKGTVLLVLRKRTGGDIAFPYDLSVEVEEAVRQQVRDLRAIDFHSSFTDGDYQLAGFAAALKAITAYRGINGVDIERELSVERRKGEKGPLEGLLELATRTVSAAVVPAGIGEGLYKSLSMDERFYVSGLAAEARGTRSLSNYQQLALSFGTKDYDAWLADKRPNHARLMRPSELPARSREDAFGSTPLYNALYAVRAAAEADEPRDGLSWLRNAFGADWLDVRPTVLGLLGWMAGLGEAIPGWEGDSRWAGILAEHAKRDGV